jgi:DNA polymerase-1
MKHWNAVERKSINRLMDEIEMPLLPILADMEQAGIRLDTDFLKNMSRELKERIAQLETQVQEGVGYPFNLNSTQQLSTALFTTLKLEPPDKRKTTTSGHYSTSADVLEMLRGKHPVVDQILEYRELAKLVSTYVEALPMRSTRKPNECIPAITRRVQSPDGWRRMIPTFKIFPPVPI